MTSRERLLAALDLKKPDRLPVTTHHVMPYFLETYLDGMDYLAFFDEFGFDPIKWVVAQKPDESKGAYFDPSQESLGFLEPRRICTDDWRIETEDIPNDDFKTVRYSFITPEKTLSMVLQSDAYTSFVSERLIKEKTDIEIVAKYCPAPLCDVNLVNKTAAAFGDRGIIRGFIPFFDVYGQSGAWQDAAVLYGIEELIMETFYDPEWVHSLVGILDERKKTYLRSMEGAKFDIIEHGGGDASSTIISPEILEQFVIPYDGETTALAQEMGQRVVYHTCGGMMPFLEAIAGMKPDAMETFTPQAMGGDTNLAEAKRRIGAKVCMIGGFNQVHYFKDTTPEETAQAVRDAFEAAGEGGGFIIAPSDHFFDAKPELLKAFTAEAHRCLY